MGIKVLPPDVNESDAELHPGRHGHPLRAHRRAQRRPQRGRPDRRGARDLGSVRGLQRLHGEGRRPGLQQAAPRVADQGRGLRRHEAPPPRADAGLRGGGRPLLVHEARRGRRPGLALRRHAGAARRAHLRHEGRHPRHRRVGQDRPCSATSARCSGSTSPTTRSPGSSTCWPTAADCTIGQLLTDEDRHDGSFATICGLITAVTRKITKTGNAWAIVTVEDLEGAIDVLFFPSDYQLASTLLVEDTVITVQGRLDSSKDQPELRGKSVSTPGHGRPGDRSRPDHDALDALHPAGGRAAQGGAAHPPRHHRGPAAPGHPGRHPRAAARRPACGSPPSPALYGDLKHLLGPGCLG